MALSNYDRIRKRRQGAQEYTKQLEQRRLAAEARKATIASRYQTPAVQNFRAQADLKDRLDATRGEAAVRAERLADRADIAQRNDEVGTLQKQQRRDQLRLGQMVTDPGQIQPSLRDIDLTRGTFPSSAVNGGLDTVDRTQLASDIRRDALSHDTLAQRENARNTNDRRQRQGLLATVEERGTSLAQEQMRRRIEDARNKYGVGQTVRASQIASLQQNLGTLPDRLKKSQILQSHAQFLNNGGTANAKAATRRLPMQQDDGTPPSVSTTSSPVTQGVDATGNPLVDHRIPNDALPISAVAAAQRQNDIDAARSRNMPVDAYTDQRTALQQQAQAAQAAQAHAQRDQEIQALKERGEQLTRMYNALIPNGENFNADQADPKADERAEIYKQIQEINVLLDQQLRPAPQAAVQSDQEPTLAEIAAMMAQSRGQ